MNVLGALEDLGLPREVSSTNILKLIKMLQTAHAQENALFDRNAQLRADIARRDDQLRTAQRQLRKLEHDCAKQLADAAHRDQQHRTDIGNLQAKATDRQRRHVTSTHLEMAFKGRMRCLEQQCESLREQLRRFAAPDSVVRIKRASNASGRVQTLKRGMTMNTPAQPQSVQGQAGHSGGFGMAGAATAHCLALDRAAVNEAVQLRDENAVLRECLAALWAEIEQVREHQRKQRSAGCSKICARPATVAERVAEHAGQAHQVQMSELKVVEQAQAISRQQYEQLVQMPAVWFREHVEPVIRSELDDLGEIASCAQGNTIQSGKPLQTERSMNAGTGTNKHNADAGTMGASTETDEGALHPRRLFAASHTHTSV